MVVDDQRIQRVVLEATLQHDNHEIIQAESGSKALFEYKNNDVDIVITDVLMPDMNGIELCFKLREINPDAKIIVISGGQVNTPGAADEYLRLGTKSGALKTFIKPVHPQNLLNCIKELML
ncbi:MAG: response regulator [Candidatus Cloacimonetes bacterium]|nr:response regulator [Candidatus Cloacimonadota bacterium]